MGRFRRAVVLGVVLTCLWGTSASAQLPLPPPPTLPPISVPAPLEPIIAVAGPTVGPVCGTASLLALLAPSIAEGYLKLPLSSLVDSATFRSYANTALYLCGFVPFPLTPTQCQADRAVVDALRGLNPLAAQVVGLSPEGATVDTVLAIEALLPSGPSVAGPLADELSLLMTCSRSAGPPTTPTAGRRGAMPPIQALPLPDRPVSLPAPGVSSAGFTIPASPPAAVVRAPSTGVALPQVFETRFVPRSGVQWLGIALAALLFGWSLVAWRSGHHQAGSKHP